MKQYWGRLDGFSHSGGQALDPMLLLSSGDFQFTKPPIMQSPSGFFLLIGLAFLARLADFKNQIVFFYWACAFYPY